MVTRGLQRPLIERCKLLLSMRCRCIARVFPQEDDARSNIARCPTPAGPPTRHLVLETVADLFNQQKNGPSVGQLYFCSAVRSATLGERRIGMLFLPYVSLQVCVVNVDVNPERAEGLHSESQNDPAWRLEHCIHAAAKPGRRDYRLPKNMISNLHETTLGIPCR